VKEATGDLARMAYTRSLVGPDFQILSGDDGVTFDMMSNPGIAACGVISVVSNVVPRAVESLTRKLLQGDREGAERLQQSLDPLFSIVTVIVDSPRTLPNGKTVQVKDKFRNPLAIKTLMNALGMPAGPVRPPLGKMTWDAVQVVRDAARRSWQLDAGLFEPVANTYQVDVAERLSNDEYWRPLAED